MTSSQPKQVFDALALPEEGRYVSGEIGRGLARIGKSHSGLPVLLVEHDGQVDGSLDALSFENLFVKSSQCLQKPGGETKPFALVELLVEDPSLIDWFFVLASRFADKFTRLGSSREIENELLTLIDLLARASRRSSPDLVGLYGELLVISLSSSPEQLVDAWGFDRRSKWDFSQGNGHVEVKTTTSDRRVHNFALEQFQDPEGLLLVSVLLRRVDTGLSLVDLIEEVLCEVTDDSKLKVQQKAYEVIGDKYREAKQLKVDAADAIRNIRMYDASEIPRIEFPPPAGITKVRYQCDLQNSNAHEFDISDPELWRATQLHG